MKRKMSFQQKVRSFLIKCFGKEIANDVTERNYRFLEESLELVQSLGCSKEDCLKLVDYVYSRPIGEVKQEIGGVMVTLAGLCCASDADMNKCGMIEVERCFEKIDAIRQKHFSKSIRSPLPGQIKTGI